MALQGVDQIRIQDDPAVIFSHPVIDADPAFGPLYIHSGANAIKWAYTLNTQSYPTIGGEVTQILSAFVGPLQIQGQTAGLATNQANKLPAGSVPGWSGRNLPNGTKNYTPNHELAAIIRWFLYYLEIAGSTTRGNQRRNEVAITFTYPNRGWSFYIQVTGLNGFRYDRDVISPVWGIDAEIISDNALNFFQGVTMSSFTDDLITNQAVGSQIGLSNFANTGTETTNFAFGNTGDAGSQDPFLNPSFSGSLEGAAASMGDNFQQLLGALAGGTFTDFAFGTLEDSGTSLPQNVDAVWQKLFGSTFIGAPGATSANDIVNSIAGGTTTYAGPADPVSKSDIVADIASSFEALGVDGALGVAIATIESGLNPDRTQDGCNSPSCGIGLFQVNGDGSGRDSSAAVKTAGQNRNYGSQQGNITPYYSAGAQIAAAAGWFSAFAKKDFPNVNMLQASDAQLAALGAAAQGASDPDYLSKVESALQTARSLVASVNVATPGSLRGAVCSWATKLVAYSQTSGLPTYAEAGRVDTVSVIAPGDFAALNPDDCSSTVAALYCWGTNNNTQYGLNGKSFDGVSTGTMYNTIGNRRIQSSAAKAGDLIIFGDPSGVHVAMLMAAFNGDSTPLFSHGSGVPKIVAYGDEVAAHAGQSINFFSVLP